MVACGRVIFFRFFFHLQLITNPVIVFQNNPTYIKKLRLSLIITGIYKFLYTIQGTV